MCLGSVVVSYVVYWTVGIFYIIMDVTLRPQAFRKYKIQPGTNEPVDTWKLLKVLAISLSSQKCKRYGCVRTGKL